MSLSIAPIQISSFQLLKSNFEVLNFGQPAESNNTFNFQFNASDLIERGNGQKGLEANLIVRLIPQNGSNAQYSMEVSARGYFLGTYSAEGGSLENFVTYMKTNAYSLLYGYIRSHVQQISSMSAIGTINLPCVELQPDAIEKPVETSLEEKPAEKPAEEKPAEEKPAEKKPAARKPAAKKPAEEKPAEKKPAPRRTSRAKTAEK